MECEAWSDESQLLRLLGYSVQLTEKIDLSCCEPPFGIDVSDVPTFCYEEAHQLKLTVLRPDTCSPNLRVSAMAYAPTCPADQSPITILARDHARRSSDRYATSTTLG